MFQIGKIDWNLMFLFALIYIEVLVYFIYAYVLVFGLMLDLVYMN